MQKECRKCLKMLDVSNFSQFIATTVSGKEQRTRNICYECNYKNQKRFGFQWSNASDKEKLKQLKQRFEEYVIKKDGCWDWKGFVRPDGYTRMKWGSRTTSIGGHIASWMIHKNTIDLGDLYVLHKCDNRKCSNPKHLFLGGSRENMIDMLNKKRSSLAKLTPIQVKNIKRSLLYGIPVSKIAAKYKVNWTTIGDIKEGRTWKHVVLDSNEKAGVDSEI